MKQPLDKPVYAVYLDVNDAPRMLTCNYVGEGRFGNVNLPNKPRITHVYSGTTIDLLYSIEKYNPLLTYDETEATLFYNAMVQQHELIADKKREISKLQKTLRNDFEHANARTYLSHILE